MWEEFKNNFWHVQIAWISWGQKFQQQKSFEIVTQILRISMFRIIFDVTAVVSSC